MTMYAEGNGPTNQPQGKIRFEVIGEAYRLVRAKAGTWILATLLYYAVDYAISFALTKVLTAIGIAPYIGSRASSFGVGQRIFGFFVKTAANVTLLAYLLGGLHRMALKQVRGGEITVGDLFSAGDVAGPLIGANLLTVIASYAGVVFCVIPGLLIAALLMLTNFVIVDQRLGAIEAMKASWNAVQGDLLNAVGLLIVLVLLLLAGVLGCGICVLFTSPIMYVALAITYQNFFTPSEVLVPQPTITMPLPPPTSGERGSL